MGEDARGAVPVLLTHRVHSPPTIWFPTNFGVVMSEDVRALALIAPDELAVQKLLVDSCKFTFADRFGQDLGQPVRAAVTSLGELLRKNPEQAKRIAPGLLTATKTMTDPEIRGQAIGTLGKMAESDADLRPQVAAGLLAFIKAGDFNAISAIAKCGRDARDALSVLKQLKLNPQVAIRTAANDAITQIEDAAASADKPTPKDEPTKPTKCGPAGETSADTSCQNCGASGRTPNRRGPRQSGAGRRSHAKAAAELASMGRQAPSSPRACSLRRSWTLTKRCRTQPFRPWRRLIRT